MIMANRGDIIERIKKLLALAEDEGATEAEAATAALMAQRLIAQNDVEQWELHAAAEEPIEACYTAPARSRWRWRLADVVAPAFRCRYSGARERCGWQKENIQRIEFYGYRTDAKAAAITFDFLYKIGCRLARRASRGKAHGTYNAYVLGYVEGIRGELYKQPRVRIEFLRGRLRFEKEGNAMGSAPFPSMLVFFNEERLREETM